MALLLEVTPPMKEIDVLPVCMTSDLTQIEQSLCQSKIKGKLVTSGQRQQLLLAIVFVKQNLNF